MSGSSGLKLCGTALPLVLGVLANLFNLVVMLLQQWRSRGVRTVALLICFISLGNVLLQTSTFAIVASAWAGVLCLPDLPLFFGVVLFAWLSSSSVSFWSVAWLSVFYCLRVLSFSWAPLRALKDNISAVLNVALPLTLLTSGLMFSPFFCLHFQGQNATGLDACMFRKPLFPAWIHVEVYVVSFICYQALMPLMVMLPTSLGLVVYLCRHSSSTLQRKQRSLLLVCRLTVALVWVYLSTLLTIALYYFHAIFSSGLSADTLFLGLSFYCSASAVLLTCSNRSLREAFRRLLCRTRRTDRTPSRTVEDQTGVTTMV